MIRKRCLRTLNGRKSRKHLLHKHIKMIIPEPCRVRIIPRPGRVLERNPITMELHGQLHQHNDQQEMKQGMRPRNTRTPWNEQVSNIKNKQEL